jgi:hypothetical protein
VCGFLWFFGLKKTKICGREIENNQFHCLTASSFYNASLNLNCPIARHADQPLSPTGTISQMGQCFRARKGCETECGKPSATCILGAFILQRIL